MKKQATRSTKHWCAHLEEADESYGIHLLFTLRLSSYIFITAFVLLIHGLLPFTFTKTAGRRIEKMYLTLKSRISKDRLEVIDNWDI